MSHSFTAGVGVFHIHGLTLGFHLAHIVMYTHHRMIHGIHKTQQQHNQVS